MALPEEWRKSEEKTFRLEKASGGFFGHIILMLSYALH
jgi:hypothetical protein